MAVEPYSQRVERMNETVFKGKHGTILQTDAEEIRYIRVSYFRRANV